MAPYRETTIAEESWKSKDAVTVVKSSLHATPEGYNHFGFIYERDYFIISCITVIGSWKQ